MAHDEFPTPVFRANAIALVEAGTTLAGNAGHIKLSGSKIHLDNGTAWEKVTSA